MPMASLRNAGIEMMAKLLDTLPSCSRYTEHTSKYVSVYTIPRLCRSTHIFDRSSLHVIA